jgi:phosphatidylglycerol---prolipoprotein diacylglyceryl transferase
MGIALPLAYLIDWGWLRIGPPYVYINIDPVIFRLGPLSVHWYGLMYVVAILIGLRIMQGYATRKGINEDMVYRVLWWAIAAGLIGGRLYFVIQQPNLVSYYLANPIHIIATWEGGMAFFGAIFLTIATLLWRARVERINPLVLLDAGAIFAAAGQIFGRIGNLINGDIIGYPSTLPWSTVYQNPNSWAWLNPATRNVPVQPAAAYELLTNIVLLSLILYLSRRITRPGLLILVYLYGYSISQFVLFYTRANDIVPFLGLNWGLKQAQWTSIVLLIVLLPITYFVLRYSKPVPTGEVAATYGIPQKPKKPLETKTLDGEIVAVIDEQPKKEEEKQPKEAEEKDERPEEEKEQPKEEAEKKVL